MTKQLYPIDTYGHNNAHRGDPMDLIGKSGPSPISTICGASGPTPLTTVPQGERDDFVMDRCCENCRFYCAGLLHLEDYCTELRCPTSMALSGLINLKCVTFRPTLRACLVEAYRRVWRWL